VVKSTIESNLYEITPNPASNFIEVNTPEGSLISIYDISGKLKIATRSKQINISQLNSAIYLLVVSSDEEIRSQKLVVL